jgi:hypothetical protein
MPNRLSRDCPAVRAALDDGGFAELERIRRQHVRSPGLSILAAGNRQKLRFALGEQDADELFNRSGTKK